MSKKLCFLISFVLVLSLAGSAQSDVRPRAISVNFSTGGVDWLESADVAGAPAFKQSNWNNVTGISGTLAAGNVKDADGNIVPGSEVTWNAGSSWTPWPAIDPATAGDKKLFHYGFIANESVSPSTVTVTNIPYDEYYVVVYTFTQHLTRGTEVTVAGTGITYCSQAKPPDPPETGFSGTWIQVTSTDPCNPTMWGNYSVHSGVTGATCTINWTPRTVGEWQDEGWVIGFQIVTLKNHLFNPIPADGSLVPVSVDLLQWTLPEPNELEGAVTCDVYFGTNSWVGRPQYKIVDNLAVESAAIGPLVADTNYYWGMGVYDDSISTTDPYLFSHVLTFRAVSNFPPVVDANDDFDTWLVDVDELIDGNLPPDANRVVQLGGIVTDDGLVVPYTVLWTVVSEPNSVTHPAVIDPNNIVNPPITMTLPGLYELELAAYDGQHTSSDTINIQLYDTSCEHARRQPGFVWLAGDLNRDCKIDFVDFANLAAYWLEEYYSIE